MTSPTPGPVEPARPRSAAPDLASYLVPTGRPDELAGGVRRVPVQTPAGTFTVWTRRLGSNPDVELLLLHGGPGATHEHIELLDSHVPAAGIEYHLYDQLGSGWSDQPDDPSLWTIDRFVDEVEQVRVALGLDASTMVLLGHSWGGVLAVEYALRHGQHLKGLVISNMMMSIPGYNAYARERLMPEMEPAALARLQELEVAGETEVSEYEELLLPHYERHVLRMPSAQWPEPVLRAFAHINRSIYVPMQWPSEIGASGVLLEWDRTDDLPSIHVPTLVIGAEHDTMDPEHLRRVAEALPQGRYLHCPQGSHMAMYHDQTTWVGGLVDFLDGL